VLTGPKTKKRIPWNSVFFGVNRQNRQVGEKWVLNAKTCHLAGLGWDFQAIFGDFLPLWAILVARVGLEPTTKGL
jgi:hypothetical protein